MSMSYEIYGPEKAPTILFLHGGGISGWMWHNQVEALSADYRCIVRDLPEHGKSINEGILSIADSAERIHKLIADTENGAPVHLVGHSIGAKIIAAYLAQHPDTAQTAVIISALFRPMPILKLTMNRPAYRLTEKLLKNESVLNWQVKQFGFRDEQDREKLSEDFRLLNADAMDHLYGELYRHLSIPDLSGVKTVCLVVAGEKEPTAMRASATDLAAAIPHARAVLFSGCRHDIPWKAADELNITIREWIKQIPLSAPIVNELR